MPGQGNCISKTEILSMKSIHKKIHTRIIVYVVSAAALASLSMPLAVSVSAAQEYGQVQFTTTTQQPQQLARRRRISSSSSLYSASTSLSSIRYHDSFFSRHRKQQQSSSLSLPHSLTLQLTFDSHPEEVSWKFQNARTQTVLDGVAFGVYNTSMVGQTVQESLDILNDLDFAGDTNETLREYRFVIYDRGGNGICCNDGNGKYEIYSKGSIIAQGSSYGSIEESLFSLDPRVYLEEKVDNTSLSQSATTSVDGTDPTPMTLVDDDNESTAPSFANLNTNDSTAANNATNQMKPSQKPSRSPQKQMANDQTWWFCGVSWDWVTSHCDEAKPCPGGDAIDCPANQACFASTPCTLAPSQRPSTDPSSMPSEIPSPSPTKAPWSETAWIGFLNGQSNSNENGDVETDADVTNGKNSSQVNEILENDSSLQYHFFCGISWTHADEVCEKFCPSGDKSECPSGQECFANTRCDGRKTASPTAVPASDASNNDADNIAGEDTCSLCNGKTLNPSKSISFQSETTTCGSLNSMLISAMQAEDNPIVQSATCNSVRDMYKNECCSEECQLCKTAGGNLLDLRGDVVVQQGGYDASCHDINAMLSKSYSEDESMCLDARTELAGKCCYQQCELCGDQSESASTFWFNTVIYQDLTTTCLGLDYLLRAEQLIDGESRCSELQAQYASQCCYRSANSCQLCDAGSSKQYKLESNKIVTDKQSLIEKPCSAVNFSLTKYQKSDAQCMDGRQAYFDECCILNESVVSEFDPTSIGGAGMATSPVTATNIPSPETFTTPVSAPGGNSGSSSEIVQSPAPVEQLETITSDRGERDEDMNGMNDVVEGKPPTSAPTLYFWGSPSKFAWEKDWDPPNRNGCVCTASLAPLLVLGCCFVHNVIFYFH